MKNQTSTGRMDQNARSAEDTASVPTKAPDSAPRTRMERLVAKCWEEELKITGIGLEDDFFALGGDSQHALQMIFRVRQKARLRRRCVMRIIRRFIYILVMC